MSGRPTDYDWALLYAVGIVTAMIVMAWLRGRR